MKTAGTTQELDFCIPHPNKPIDPRTKKSTIGTKRNSDSKTPLLRLAKNLTDQSEKGPANTVPINVPISGGIPETKPI